MKPELEVQKFLRSGGTLERLEGEFAIKNTRHTTLPNLVLLKYNQIESPFKEPLVRECRGIILDEANAWNVVSMGYTKFFNAGESSAAQIDWKTAKVWEKLDGSLIVLYRYANDWHVSTSGVPDATCSVGDFGLSFAQLFWDVYTDQWDDVGGPPAEQFPDNSKCYVFELCCPENRVVVPHKTKRVVLHGVRNMDTLQEEDPTAEAFRLGYALPRSWSLGSLDEVTLAAGQLAPLEQEGYVVCDAQFNRVKVKSPAYVTLHHAKDGLISKRHIADIVRKGEHSEALSYFPELGHVFDDLKQRYDNLVRDIDRVWLEIRATKDRKGFAQLATQHRFSGALFALRDEKASSAQSYLLNIPEAGYHRLLGI